MPLLAPDKESALLQSKGFDPSTHYIGDDGYVYFKSQAPSIPTTPADTVVPTTSQVAQPIDTQSPLATGATHALANVPAAAVGLAATAPGAEGGAIIGGLVPPPFDLATIPIGALIGGLLTGGAAAKVTKMGTDAVMPDSIENYLKAGEKQNPDSAILGDIASQLVVLRPNPANIVRAGKTLLQVGASPVTKVATDARDIANLINVGGGAAIGGGMDLADQGNRPEGQPLDKTRLIASIIAGATLNEPNSLGTKIPGVHAVETGSQADDVATLLNQVKNGGTAMVPKDTGAQDRVQDFFKAQKEMEQPAIDAANQAKADADAKAQANQALLAHILNVPTADPKALDAMAAVDNPPVSQNTLRIEQNKLLQPDIARPEVQPNVPDVAQLTPDNLSELQNILTKNQVSSGDQRSQAEIEQDKLEGNGARQSEQPEDLNTWQKFKYSVGEALKGNPNLSGITVKAFNALKKFSGNTRNVDLQTDGSIIDQSTKKPIAGLALMRDGVQTAIAKINPNTATLGTAAHEPFHIFFDDLQHSPDPSQRKVANDFLGKVAKTDGYQSWASDRQSQGLDSSPDEFVARLNEVEFQRYALANKGKITEALGDFKSGLKDIWGNATSEDYARLLRNKFLYDRPFSQEFAPELAKVGLSGKVNTTGTPEKKVAKDIPSEKGARVNGKWMKGEDVAKLLAGSQESAKIKSTELETRLGIDPNKKESDNPELNKETWDNAAKYRELQQKLLGLDPKSQEFQDTWKELENVKNNNGGIPPSDTKQSELPENLKEQTPWEKAGISRRTWYYNKDNPKMITSMPNDISPEDWSKLTDIEKATRNPELTKYPPQAVPGNKYFTKPEDRTPVSDKTLEANRELINKQIDTVIHKRLAQNQTDLKSQPNINREGIHKEVYAELKGQGLDSDGLANSAWRRADAAFQRQFRGSKSVAEESLDTSRGGEGEATRHEEVASPELAPVKESSNVDSEATGMGEGSITAAELADKLSDFESNPKVARILDELDKLPQHEPVDIHTLAEKSGIDLEGILSRQSEEPELGKEETDKKSTDIIPEKQSWNLFTRMAPEIEKIRKLGEGGAKLADAFTSYYRGIDRFRGQYEQSPIRDMWKARGAKYKSIKEFVEQDNPDFKAVLDYRDKLQDGLTPDRDLTPVQDKINDRLTQLFRDTYPLAKGDVDANTDNAETYSPHVMSRKAMETLANPSEAMRQMKQEFLDYRTGIKGQSQEEALSDWDELRKSFTADNRQSPAKHFGPVDKAQGQGLPESMREGNLVDRIGRYTRRLGKRISYRDNIENNDTIQQTLRSPDEGLAANEYVRRRLDDIHGYNEEREAKIQALSGIIRSGMFGTLTGAKDIATSGFLGWRHQDLSQIVPSTAHALMNIKSSIEDAFNTGVLRHDLTTLETGEGGLTKMNSVLANIRRMSNQVQLRQAEEQLSRGITFGQGKWLAADNINALQKGKLSGQQTQFLEKFVPDWQKYREGEIPDSVLNEAAARYVENNQGTYDARGLPDVAMRGTGGAIFSLMRWNIERMNTFNKDVIGPAKRGNIKPLLMETLGLVAGGAVVEKLVEEVTKKKSPAATMSEIQESYKEKGDWEDLAAYKTALLADYAGYGGFLGVLAHGIMDKRLHNNTPSLDVPILSVTSSMAKDMFDYATAVANGQGAHATDLLGQLLSDYSQSYRLTQTWSSNNKQTQIDSSNKRRDLKEFQVSDREPLPEPPSSPDTFANSDIREFKHEQDLGKAQQELQPIIQKIVEDNANNPEGMMNAFRALKQNSYQTMPKIGTMEFVNYVNFLTKTQGSEEASKRITDFVTHNAINRAKSSMVP